MSTTYLFSPSQFSSHSDEELPKFPTTLIHRPKTQDVVAGPVQVKSVSRDGLPELGIKCRSPQLSAHLHNTPVLTSIFHDSW